MRSKWIYSVQLDGNIYNRLLFLPHAAHAHQHLAHLLWKIFGQNNHIEEV
jgi:hypothetical protein